jgi:hypothetical protein
MSFRGPSKLAPGLAAGEEHRLLGDDFEVEPFARPFAQAACFLLRRQAALPTSEHPPT